MARKRLLTFSSDGRWRKQIGGTVYYFGRGRCASDTRSYKEAEERLLEFLAERNRTKPIDVRLSRLTLKDAAEKYLQQLEARLDRKDISPSYMGRSVCHMRHLVDALGPNTILRQIGELDLDEYRTQVLRLPRSSSTKRPIRLATAKNRLDAVKAFYRWCYRHHIIDAEPRNLLDYTKFTLDAPRVKTFSMAEVQALWSAACERTRTFIALGLNCGFGQKDIGDLLTKEIDLEAGLIERERSKTGVPSRHKLWAVTIELLRRQRRQNAEPDQPYFTTADGEALVRDEFAGGKVKKTDAIKNAFWRVQYATKVNGGRGFYTLRKTAATEIERIDPLVTSMFLAHSPKEMKRFYALRNWESLDKALLLLEPRFNLRL